MTYIFHQCFTIEQFSERKFLLWHTPDSYANIAKLQQTCLNGNFSRLLLLLPSIPLNYTFGIFLREAPNYKLHWVPINESFNFKLHICWSPLTLFYSFVTEVTTLQNLFPLSKPYTCLRMGPPPILISSDESYSTGVPLDDKILVEKHSLNGEILMKSLSHSYLIVRNSTCNLQSFVKNKVFGTCHDNCLFIFSYFLCKFVFFYFEMIFFELCFLLIC